MKTNLFTNLLNWVLKKGPSETKKEQANPQKEQASMKKEQAREQADLKREQADLKREQVERTKLGVDTCVEVSEEQGASEEQGVSEMGNANHALITQLSRTNHPINLRCSRYAAVLFMVFVVGIGQAWGTDFTITLDQFRTIPVSGLVKIDNSNLSLSGGSMQLSSGNQDFTVSTTNSDYKIKRIVFTATKSVIKYGGEAISESTFTPASPGTSFTLNLTASGGTAKISQMAVTLTTTTSETLEALVATALSEGVYTTGSSVITLSTVGGGGSFSTSGQEYITMGKSSGTRSLTVATSSSYNIKFIALAFYEEIFPYTISASTGTYTAASYLWTPGATPTNSVTLTFNTKDGGSKIRRVIVGYEAASAGCSAYEFHYGTHGEDDWETACFEQVGETNEWKIEGFTIPSTPNYYVGYHGDGEGGWNSTWSSERAWTDWPTKSDNKWQGQIFLTPNDGALGSFAVGQATGATGTLTIHSNYNDYNKFLSFTPDGYGITYSGSGHAFAETATSNMYETDVVTLPNCTTTYNIGLKTSTAGTYVKSIHSKTTDEALSAMGVTIKNGGKKKVLFNPAIGDGDGYITDGSKIAVYDCTNSSFDGFMTDSDEDGVYEGYVGSTCSTICIVRYKSDKASPDWTGADIYNQTIDFSIGDLLTTYKIANWDDKTDGKQNNITSTYMHPTTGEKGKFRMWANSASSNWYVHFIPYNVLSYDGNGGTGTTAQTERNTELSTTVTVASNGFTAPTGYTFKGWATDDSRANEGTVDYDPDDSYTLTANATLYAAWSPKTCTVSFDNNGGTGTITSVTATYDAAMPSKESNLPTKSGYDFAGFWDGEGGTGTQYYNADGTSAQNWDKNTTSTTTLYAKWTAHTYTVTLDGDGGSTSPATLSPVYNSDLGTSPVITAASFSPYTFSGFYTGHGGTGTQIIGIDKKWVKSVEGWTDGTPKWIHTSDETLYAHWSREYIIDKNGGSANGKVVANYKGTMGTITAPTYAGCTPDGYYAESSCSTLVMATDGTLESDVTDWTSSDRKWIQTTSSHLNAHWKIDAPTISCSRNEVTISTTLAGTTIYYTTDGKTPTTSSSVYSAPFTIDEDKTVKAYAVKSNFTDSDPASASCTYETTYDVSYDANLDGASGSTTSQTGNFTEEQVATRSCGFSKDGYKFKWWNTKDDGTGEDFYVGEKVTIATSDVTLYAQWEEVGTGEEFWCGIPDEWHATTHDVTVGDMKVTAKDYSSSNNYINKAMGKYKEYTVVSATNKHATVIAAAEDNYYIQVHFSDGSTINELNLGVTTSETTDQNIVVCYSTTADFSTGEHEFVKVGSTDNVVQVPGHNQSTKSVTNVSPSTENKYTHVRIYRKLSNGTDYNSTGAALGSSAKARIYSIKAKKGIACTSPTIGSQPADVAICPGSTTTLTVSSITGGNTPYTYRWYDASDDSAVSSGSGYTTASFTTPTLDAAASYYCIVTENGGCTTQSETADVTMKTTTAITSGPSSVANAVVGSPTSLSVTAEGTNLSYQWYTCDDDEKTNADDLDDKTDATLSVTPASVGVTYYYCVVSGDCGTETSDVVSITAKNSISPTLTYASTVTYGSTISPTLSGAGDGSVTYSLNSVDPANSLSINSSTGVVTGVTAGGSATVTATITAGDNYWGGSAISSTITVAKADLSVTATAGTATSITHNSATLPFELSSTDGVGSVTLKVYNTSDVLVKTVSGVTAATSGSGNVTGLDASTTYYFTVKPIGDANHNDGDESSESEEFTTEESCTPQSVSKVTMSAYNKGSASGYNYDEYAGTPKYSLQNASEGSTHTGYKLGSGGHHIYAQLGKGSFEAGDVIKVYVSKPNDAYKVGETAQTILDLYVHDGSSTHTFLHTIEGVDEEGEYSYTLTESDITTISTNKYIGVYRPSSGRTQNPYIYSVEIEGCRSWTPSHDVSTVVSGSGGGIVSAAASSVMEGKTTTITATPAKGYVVTNWAVSGTGASITPSGASSSTTTTLTMGTTDATVTVTFGVADYSVTYNGNSPTSGSVPTDGNTYHYGDEVTVADNTGSLVKTGYTFRGWTSGDYFYAAGDKFTITGNTTLTAVWESNSGDITCNAYVWYENEAGKSTDRFTFTSTPSGSTSQAGSMTIGGTEYTSSYRSSDWNSSFTFSVTSGKMGVLYFFGKSQGDDRTLTITNNTTSATTTITGIGKDSYSSYNSSGFPAGSYTVSTNGKLYVCMFGLYECDIDYYDVSFDNENGFAGGATVTLPSNIEGVPAGKKMAQPADPTTTGDYVFGGWYDDEDCSDGHEINWNAMTITENVTIYAKWYDQEYTVTWKVNGSTHATTKACRYVPIVLPTAPADNTLSACETNSFRGWSETNLYGEANDNQPSDLFIDPADAPTIGANKTYYAIFGTATDAAYVNTVLWSENWTGESKSATPSIPTTGGGYTILGAGIEYTWKSGDGTSPGDSYVTTDNSGNLAGGLSPEVILGKKGTGGTTGGSLIISGIPNNGAKKLTLQYKQNDKSVQVSVSGTGYYFDPSGTSKTSNTADDKEYTIICGTDATFTLTFTATTTTAARIDDIVVKVKEDGATDYRCICPSLTLVGPSADLVFVTSTAEKTVRSQEAFTVSGTGLTKNRALTTGTFGSSKFEFKTATGGTVSTNANGDLEETDVYVYYTPDAEDDTDGLDEATEVTISIEGAGAATSNDLYGTKRVIGRHLPEKFIIAEQVGGDWYALPNDMGNNYTSSTKAVKISAVADGVATIYSDITDQFAYQLLISKDLGHAGMVFSSPRMSSNIIKAHTTASTATIGLYAQSGWTGDNIKYYEFTPTTTDLVDYTLKNTFQNNYLGITSSDWGIGASANVRFFAIDQQAAPTITWRNNMLGEDHATNKAENGVVTLPDTDPESCNSTLYPTFCGWSATQPIGSYWTSAPSYVEEGDVAISDQTYYAVFKDATRNRWYTQCPTFYTLTFNRGTGTGDDYVAYTDLTTYTLPDAATTGLSKDGYTLSGWTTTVDVTVGGSPVTAGDVISVGATVSGISTDLTFTAVWTGNISITAPNGVWLTSYNGVTVYSTSETENLITVSTPAVTGATGIRLTYLDESANTVAPGSSLFRLCYSSNYNVEDGQSYPNRLGELTLNAGVYSTTYSISYTPAADSYNTTNTYTLKLELMRNSTVLSEATVALHGRALPQEFVVASKFGGDWYALPNTLAATQETAKAVAGIKITVDNTTTPTKATYAPSSTVYKGEGRYAANSNRYGIRLTDGTNHLQVSTTGSNNKMWLSSSGSANCQDWWLNCTDFSSYYTVTIPSNTGNESKKIGMDGGNIGYYESPTSPSEKIYFLPIEHTLVDNPASVTEWGQKSVILDVDAQASKGIEGAQARIGNGAAEAATSFGQTLTSVKGSATKYNYTVSFSTTDFSAHKGELLYIDWLDGESEVVSTSAVTIPWIIASNTDMYTADKTKGHWDTEVHVLPGVTLTADASGKFANNSVTVKQLEIYPGATVKVTSGTLDVTNLVLRNGWTRVGEKAFDVARLYINSSANLTHMNAYADWYIDYDQYYPIAVPFPVATSGISYKNSNSAANAGVKLRYYSGELRATNIQQNQDDNWVEYKWNGTPAMPTNLEPSKGYIMTAKRPTGKAFSIVRMPMTFSNDWTTGGEKGSYVDGSSVTHTKNQVTVTAWGNENTPSYAKGWNIIANPYMSLHQGALSYNDGSGEEIAYANIPDVSFKEYDQVPIETTELKPASAFLVQAPKTGTVTFSASNRKASAPSYRREVATETLPRQKAYIVLNNEQSEDMMGILVSDQYTAEYEINADLEKLLGDGTSLKTYMHYGDRSMAYVAINKVLAQEWIPVSVRLPQAGEYTFSLHEASRVSELEGLYLIDYTTNEITNLLVDSYTFDAEAGTISNRFSINAIVGERQTPTDIDVVGADKTGDGPIKFLYRDKVYIWHNGVIYDATGKVVKGGQK